MNVFFCFIVEIYALQDNFPWRGKIRFREAIAPDDRKFAQTHFAYSRFSKG